MTHARPRVLGRAGLGMCQKAKRLPSYGGREWEERSTHGSQMLAALGSGQVQSSSWLRQEFTETSSEMFLAAEVSIWTVWHHVILVCFVKYTKQLKLNVWWSHGRGSARLWRSQIFSVAGAVRDYLASALQLASQRVLEGCLKLLEIGIALL